MGGTFQSLASAYYHLKSTRDRDVSGSTQNPRAKGNSRDIPTSKSSKKTPLLDIPAERPVLKAGLWLLASMSEM